MAKVTPVRRHQGGTTAYRAIADRIASEATQKAFRDYFRIIAKEYPRGSTDRAVKAFAAALRSNIERYEGAEPRRAGGGAS